MTAVQANAQATTLPSAQANAHTNLQSNKQSTTQPDTHCKAPIEAHSGAQASSSQAIIDVQHVSFCYPGAEANTLNDVSLRIQRGDFVAIIGSNGSGKSTLCKCLNGLIPTYYTGDFQGKVLINGIDTSSTTIAQLSKHVAYVFQDFENQLVRPTVFDELCFAPLNFGYENYKDRAVQALRMLDIEELSQRWIWQLSGGQKHMVALAAALALDPEVIIVDEPVAQLDPAHAKLIYEKLAMLNEIYQKTIIVIEHHTEYIADYCKNVILLDRGGRVRWKQPVNAALSAIEELHELHIQPPQVTQAMAALQLRDADTKLYPVTIEQAVQLLQPILDHQPLSKQLLVTDHKTTDHQIALNQPKTTDHQTTLVHQPTNHDQTLTNHKPTHDHQPMSDHLLTTDHQTKLDHHSTLDHQSMHDHHSTVDHQSTLVQQSTHLDQTLTNHQLTIDHQPKLVSQPTLHSQPSPNHRQSSLAQATAPSLEQSPTDASSSSTTRNALVRIDHASSGYQSMDKQHKATLRHIDLTIYEGDRIALVGNNGAGKSTLLRLIAGIRKPWSGSVNVCGKDTRSATPEQLSDTVSFIFQNPEEMFIADHIREDIEFFLKARKQANIEPFINHIIDTFNLTELQQRDGRLLSGGQQRRATLAIGLAMKPTVMLLDEPTASLDIVSRREMTKLFDELHDQVQAIVVATHDMQLVADWATRVIVMHDGAILLDTSSEEVFQHPHLLKLAALIPPQIVQLGHALQWQQPALSVAQFVERIQQLARSSYISNQRLEQEIQYGNYQFST